MNNKYFKTDIKTLLLLSAGLDSYVIFRLLDMPESLYFALNTKAMEQELNTLEKIKEFLPESKIYITEILKLAQYEEKSGYVPYRNLLFLLYTSLMFPNRTIIIGQVLEWQVDKNKSFYKKVERMFKDLGHRENKIIAPFANYTKTELVREFIKKGFNPNELINLSRSCIYNNLKECGKCSNCINKWIAFKNNNIDCDFEENPTFHDWKSNIFLQKKKFRFSNLYIYIKSLKDAFSAFF